MPAKKTDIQIDPNVSIPLAVRRQAEIADAAFKAQTTSAESPPEEGVTPPEGQVTPEGNTPEPPIAPEVPPAAPTPANENWEHKYNSMKGRFERAQNDIRLLSDQVGSLQSLLANAHTPQQDEPAELRAESLLTPEEVNEYGPEFLGVVAKKAKEELSPEVRALRKELDTIKSRLESTQVTSAANARRNLEQSLDDQVPTWRDVNVAPEFHQWLALPDVFSGAIRHQLLSAAYERNDTPRVLAFFKGFLADEAASDPAPSEPDQTGQEPGKIPLETFAAPGRAKTAAANSAPAEKPTFTRTQISKFYADSASGKYRGRETEKDRIEAQIFAAEREGRIR